jgi:hypothetical protein
VVCSTYAAIWATGEEETDEAVLVLVAENGLGDLVVVGRHCWSECWSEVVRQLWFEAGDLEGPVQAVGSGQKEVEELIVLP